MAGVEGEVDAAEGGGRAEGGVAFSFFGRYMGPSIRQPAVWILSMSRSPSLQGLSGTVHARAVVLALSEVRLRVVVPVASMKSMA